MSHLVKFAFIHVIVAIDHALFAGMFVPFTSRKNKRKIVTIVGVAVAFSQILLATWIDRILNYQVTHTIVIIILTWMSIQTIIHTTLLSVIFQ